MSLFRKAGEKFEETKKAYMEGEEVAYACGACEESVDDNYEYCPHCGEDAVEPVE